MKNVIKTLLYMSTASIRMNCKYPGIICNDNKKEKNKRKIHKCQLQIHYCHCMHINQAHLAHLNNFFFAVNTFQPQCEMFLFFHSFLTHYFASATINRLKWDKERKNCDAFTIFSFRFGVRRKHISTLTFSFPIISTCNLSAWKRPKCFSIYFKFLRCL